MIIHIFDYDGTLERLDQKLSPSQSRLLDIVESRGDLWTIATGKSWPGLKKMLHGRMPTAPFTIVDCGGRIVDAKETTVHHWQVPAESFLGLEDVLYESEYAVFCGLKNTFDCYHFSPDGTCIYAEDKPHQISDAAEFLSIATKTGCAKLTIAAPDDSTCIPDAVFHHRTGKYRDIISREAGKGPALLTALKLFAAELSSLEVAMYGDSTNDIGMFRLGIALGGACTTRAAIGPRPPTELLQASTHHFNTLQEAFAALY